MKRYRPVLVTASLLGACTAPTERPKPVSAEVVQTLRDLAGRRVFFVHQSVGDDILAGLADLAHEGRVDLRIVDVSDPSASIPEGPALLHARGGTNTEPRSKLAYLAQRLDEWPSASALPEIALVKLCFIDFAPETDIEALADAYQETLDRLRMRHANVVFAHATVPLMARPTDLKARLYRAIGRPVWVDASNAARVRFSDALVTRFESDPIVDIARAESTRPDGARERDEHGALALVPRYTHDGAHLDALGRRMVAAAFAESLAVAPTLPERHAPAP